MKSYNVDKIRDYIDKYVNISGEKISFSMITFAKKLKQGVRISTKDEIENSKGILTEKFKEDSDPIKDMGIGAKLVYYHFIESTAYEAYNDIRTVFYLILIGKNVADTQEELYKIIPNNHIIHFTWRSYMEGWKSDNYYTEEEWLDKALKIFKYIEKSGKYLVVPSNNTEFEIPGYNYHDENI